MLRKEKAKKEWKIQEAREQDVVDAVSFRDDDETDFSKQQLLQTVKNMDRRPPVARFLALFGGITSEQIALEMTQ